MLEAIIGRTLEQSLVEVLQEEVNMKIYSSFMLIVTFKEIVLQEEVKWFSW